MDRSAVPSADSNPAIVRALRGLSGAGRGEFVALMGPDCGESTLLTAFAGLDRPREGTIEAGAGRAVRMRAERVDERACGLP
jgi:ABC-type sulfate/molybdate transport systems ATPase subunit